jgi:radical SAM protein with 4Fe4S-binding SPASM domain
MTSNGFLFTESIAERAISSWNLKSVQITLDGTEEVYNKTKSYVNIIDNPYQRVLSNIKLLLKYGIQVIIRLNLDMHNIEDLQALIAELDQTMDKRENLEVYAHVLFEDAGFAPIERDEKIRKMLYARLIEINNQLSSLRLGRSVRSLPFLKTHKCMADAENSIAVYPDGRLYKCEHIEIGDECGDVNNDILKTRGVEKFQLTTEFQECSSCPLYPSCILLKNCQGINDYNQITCNYNVENTAKSLEEYYRRFINKG